MKRATALALALAATTLSPMALAGSDSGLYAGGSFGTSEISEDDFDDATGYKIFGGYNFGMVPFVNLAAELSYLDFGSFDAEVGSTTVDATALALSVLVGFDFGPVGVFGKAGYFSWDAEVDSDQGNTSDDGTDPAYGIGAKFQLGPFSLRAEYEVFDLDGTDIDFYSVGAAYTF